VNGKDVESLQGWENHHQDSGVARIQHAIPQQRHLDNMRGRYFRDMSIVRVGGDNNVPAPEED
jgi:hypothetical protein